MRKLHKQSVSQIIPRNVKKHAKTFYSKRTSPKIGKLNESLENKRVTAYSKLSKNPPKLTNDNDSRPIMTAKLNNRMSKARETFYSTLTFSQTGKDTIGSEGSQSAKFAPHSKFAPTRFHRQPQFKILR